MTWTRLELDLCYARAWIARSNVLEALGLGEEALKSCDMAISLGPSRANALLAKAMILLRHGRLLDGFALYEHRWESTKFVGVKRDFKVPR